MSLVAGDANLRRVRRLDGGDFEVTRLDRSTFTARLATGETTDGNLATVTRIDDGTVEVLVSHRAEPAIVERIVANALAQASALLLGDAATANVLGATTHPAGRTTLSEEDAGRQSELRNLDRAARNTLNPVRRLGIAREMRALVEHLGVHADDDAGPQRRAVLDYDVRGILGQRARAGSRRPDWAGHPSGHPTWKAFRPHLVAELLPGLGASVAIAGTGAPLVATGVAVATVVTATTGTLVKRWHGRRDKKLVDSGHGYGGELRAFERGLRRRELAEQLFARMRSMGIDLSVPGPPEPPPKGDWPKRTQPYLVRLVNRGLPLMAGALASTILVPGLPVWNVATHWGIAGASALLGPLVEGWLRNRMVSREWKWFDQIFRDADKVAAAFDEQFARRLHALMDRFDALAGATPPQVTVRSSPVEDSPVPEVAPGWFWANAVPGAVGDFVREATGGATKVGEAFTSAMHMGELRFALGALINGFLDRRFTVAEYGEITTQVAFDAGSKMAEQVALDHQVLEAMFAKLERQLADAEAAAARIAGSLPSRAAHLTAGPPPPALPANPADSGSRPVGRQSAPAFRRLGALQGIGLWGAVAVGAHVFQQGWAPLIVVGVAASLVFGSSHLRFMFRRSEQDAVDASVLADRANERVVEAATGRVVRSFLEEVLARELAAAEELAAAGPGPHRPLPPLVPPQVPSDLDARDPNLPDHVEALTAHERERLLRDPRPVLLLGPRLLGLERLNRLAARVREFERNGAAAPLAQARADLVSTWQAYQELVSDGTPMPTDRELLTAATPDGDPRLRRYLDESVAYPGGRALYAAGDPLRSSAAAVPPDPDRYTIDMHGGDGYVRIGRDRLTAAELAAMIRADPRWRRQPIRLLACLTGQAPDGFAQQLADLLGVPVTAPTQYVGVTDDNQLYVTALDTGPTGTRPVLPPTGELRTFQPRNPAPAPGPATPQGAPADLDLDVANPWRLRGAAGDAYQPSQAELDLSGGQVVEMDLLGGANSALLVTFANRVVAVLKLAVMEMRSLQEGIGGDLFVREVAAYRLDRMLGFGLVPATVFHQDGRREGSLQEYLRGATEGRAVNAYTRLERQRMAVLDYILGNIDRHVGNFLTRANGRLVAIDHGLTLPNGNEAPIRSSFVAAYLGRPLDEEVLAAVRAVDQDELRRMLIETGLEQRAVDLAIARLAEVRKGRITGEAWGGEIQNSKDDMVLPPAAKLAPFFRRFFAESIAYEGGRAFFSQHDVLRESAHLVPPEPEMYTIDLHGGENHVRIGNYRLNVEQLAALIEADPNWDGRQAIRLLACRTGRLPGGFAQQLADRLGVPVLAPTEHVGVTDDNQVFVAEARVNEMGVVVPVEPMTGRMVLFHPGADQHGSSERLPLVDFQEDDLPADLDFDNPYRWRGAGPERPAWTYPDPMQRGFWWPDHGEVVIGPMRDLVPDQVPPATEPEPGPDGGDRPRPRRNGGPGNDAGGPGGGPGGGPAGDADDADDEARDAGGDAGGGSSGDNAGGGAGGGDSGGAGGGTGEEPGGDQGEEQPEDPHEPDEVDENVPPPGLEPIYSGDERLWPDELAELIANGPEWDGGPIRLLVLDGQVDAEFVQRLADLLGVPVLVPADAVVDGFPSCSSGTLEVYDEPAPVTPPDGDWRVVEPRTTHTATGMAGTTVEAP